MSPATKTILATLRRSKTRFTPNELAAFFADVRERDDATLLAAYAGPPKPARNATPAAPAWHQPVAAARRALGAKQSRFVDLMIEQIGPDRLRGYRPAQSHRSSLAAFLNALAKHAPEAEITAAAEQVARAKALIYQAA